MTRKTLDTLTRQRKKTPGIEPLDKRGPYYRGERGLYPADDQVRSYAQNLIDAIDTHGHLREAKIAIIMQTGLTPDADGRTELGKARRTNPLLSFLADGADFLILLNAATWADAKPPARLSLLDHELTHCGVTIAGKYLTESAAGKLKRKIGDDFLGLDHNDTDVEGRMLARYRKRTGDIKPGSDGYADQPYAWRLRKHDIAEFTPILRRWGQRAATAGRLFDVVVPDDGQLLLPLPASEPLAKKAKKAKKAQATDPVQEEATEPETAVPTPSRSQPPAVSCTTSLGRTFTLTRGQSPPAMAPGERIIDRKLLGSTQAKAG